MALFQVSRKALLTLVLYLASTLNLALSETDTYVNSQTINTTNSENWIRDTRDPSFLENVGQGLRIAETIATILLAHPIYLVQIRTITPSGYPSSSPGDFTQIILEVYMQGTGQIELLRSSQPWGTWAQIFTHGRPMVPGSDHVIPYAEIARNDQVNAFNALTANSNPWYIVFLRMGSTPTGELVPIWHFVNLQMRRCTLTYLNRDGDWYVEDELIWRYCAESRLPANVSVPQAFPLTDANNNITSSSSNLLAGSSISEVA